MKDSIDAAVTTMACAEPGQARMVISGIARYLITMAILCSSSAFAEIYKWVDADGKVHFSDKKTARHDAQKVDVTASEVGEPDAGELRRRELLRRAEEDFQRNLTGRQDADVADSPATSPAADACNDARIRLGILAEQMPVYWTASGELRPNWIRDTYRGKREYIDDAERPQLRAQAQHDMNNNCADPRDANAMARAYNKWIDEEVCAVLRVKIDAAHKPRTRTPRGEIEKLEGEFARDCTS